MKIKRLLGFVAIAVASVGILAACGKDAAKDQTVVRVGTMAKSESEQARWDKIEEILKKEGITLKFSEFTDYSQPNVALNNGDIDINAFQHYNFLDNWNSDPYLRKLKTRIYFKRPISRLWNTGSTRCCLLYTSKASGKSIDLIRL